MLVDVRDEHSLLIAIGYILQADDRYKHLSLEEGLDKLKLDVTPDGIRESVDYMATHGKRRPIEGGY